MARQTVQRPMGGVTENRVLEPDFRNLRRHDSSWDDLGPAPLINMTLATGLLAQEYFLVRVPDLVEVQKRLHLAGQLTVQLFPNAFLVCHIGARHGPTERFR